MKSTPTRGVKQFLKPNAYKQLELDWTLMTIPQVWVTESESLRSTDMDGTLAVLFLVASLTDMGINHCSTGCLATGETPQRLALSYGDVQFQEKSVDKELYLRYDFGRTYGPFQPAIGASVTGRGDAWIGIGATWTAQLADTGIYGQLHLMPGVYARGSGPNLGHTIEFRSGAEIGYQARNGVRFGISYDHRSNAELSSVNPGLETLQFRVSIPF